MGSIITRDPQLHLRLRATRRHIGMGVSGNDVETILRGLPSIGLRYEHHDTTTRALAQWAATRPEFAQVLHPSLPRVAGPCLLARAVQARAGRCCRPVQRGLRAAAQQRTGGRVLRRIAACSSWATAGVARSVWSCPTHSSEMRSVRPDYLQAGTVVRFSVGPGGRGRSAGRPRAGTASRVALSWCFPQWPEAGRGSAKLRPWRAATEEDPTDPYIPPPPEGPQRDIAMPCGLAIRFAGWRSAGATCVPMPASRCSTASASG